MSNEDKKCCAGDQADCNGQPKTEGTEDQCCDKTPQEAPETSQTEDCGTPVEADCDKGDDCCRNKE